MAEKKHLSSKAARACRVLISEGATKTDLAKSLGMTAQTLNKKLDQEELHRLRKEVSKNQSSDSKVLKYPDAKEA